MAEHDRRDRGLRVEIEPQLSTCVRRGERRAGVALLRAHGLEQVPDHLVAAGGNADFLAGSHERANHLRPDVGLAGAGRSLNREHRAIERRRQADGEVDDRLASS